MSKDKLAPGTRVIIIADPDGWLASYNINIGDTATVLPYEHRETTTRVKFDKPLKRHGGNNDLGVWDISILPTKTDFSYILRHRAKIAWQRGDYAT